MYRTIQTETWDDPWFADLSPSAKLLFLFLITNRRVSQCGAMQITMRQISFETGLTPATIPALIESFGDRVRWWQDHQILIIRNFYRHQRANTGDKFDIAATKSAELLPIFAKSWVYGVYPHLAPSGYTPPSPTNVPPDTDGVSEQDSNRTEDKTKTEAKQEPPQPPEGERVRSIKPPDISGFDDFYVLFPRHIGRDPAEKSWAKLKPEERAAAIAAIRDQITWPSFADCPPEKIPHPTTWLNQRRWTDEPPKLLALSANGRASPIRSGGAAKGGLTPAEILAYGKRRQEEVDHELR